MKLQINKDVSKKIFQIWQQLLPVEDLRIDEDFFNLGGTSLLATQLLAKIRQELYIKCTLKDFFKNPTISFLLEHSENHANLDTHLQCPAISKTQDYTQQLFPLSFAQKRLWFIEQLYPSNGLYNDIITFQLKGEINIEALSKAFHALIERHSILKAKFISEENSTVWQSFDTLSLPNLIVVDLTNLLEEKKKRKLKHFINKEMRRNFDLSQGSLIRIFLITLNPNKHVLLITMHHIISDGWSLKILSRDLSTLYNSFSLDQNAILKDLPIQYVNFALWQGEWLQGGILEKQLSYWQKKLEGIPETINLPTDHPRPQELTYRGASYHSIINKDVWYDLRKLGQQQKATPFMTLVSAFQAFLSRYSMQEDIVIGTPIANRHYPQVEELIGFFVNTLVLRAHCDQWTTFKELLLQVKETTLEAYEHQDIPFEQLVEHLKISRALNRNPVFQIMFLFEGEEDKPKLLFKNVEAQLLPINQENSLFDLTFYLSETQEGLSFTIKYPLDLFEKNTIHRMSNYFKVFLENILKNPNQPLYKLSLLTQEKQNQLLIGYNETKAAPAQNKTLHQIFEEQAKRIPDQIATVYKDKKLTYQHLNEKANQIAHHLRRQGVGPETLVALALEKSLEMIIGIIAILKAGGAYVPLDISNPQERLLLILKDTKTPILLTHSSLKNVFNQYKGIIFTLDKEGYEFQQEPKTNPSHLTTPDHLAYVIYTSGSTGKPKGVMIRHRSVCNLLQSFVALFKDERRKACSLWTNINFDVSAYEIFSTLLNGRELHILTDETRSDSNALFNFMCLKNIEDAYCPPSMLQDLLTFSASQKNPLKNLLVGVEPIPYKVLSEILEYSPNLTIINGYGPTEATVCSTLYLLSNKQAYSSNDTTPIGRPILNTQVYILDEHLNPVPMGISGEIYLGGVGLARGYINQPNLTAESFIPNPFMDCSSHIQVEKLRLYRTGDIARYLSDGNIEFLGRFDDQIKIRGVRIELKEIESILRAHEDVEEVFVTVYESKVGNKKLAAYIVPHQKKRLTLAVKSIPSSFSRTPFSILTGEALTWFTEDLRNHLIRFVPDYMTPSFFLYLDKIPHTPDGKVDREHLPTPALSHTTVKEKYVAPSTALEQKLTSIWSEVLKIEKISIFDNFFRIGGDSIISIQLVAKARQHKLYFSAKDVFNHPTIASLSSAVKTKEDTVTLKADQNSTKGIILLSPIQHWFFQQNFSHQNHYNQSFLLMCNRNIKISVLKQALNLLISHHDALQFRYYKTPSQGWKQQGFGKNTKLIDVLKVVNLSDITETNLADHFENESNRAQKTLDLKRGPLINAIFFDCGHHRPARFLIVIHHLIIDGVSWRILLEDLERFYVQILKGDPYSLPVKTHSYQQWVAALHEFSTSHTLIKEIPYWKEIQNQIRDLPTDFNKDPPTGTTSSSVLLSLTGEETYDLLYNVNKAYKTEINDILLTALVLAIGDWKGSYDLSLSLEGHGREEIINGIDLSRTIGWFTSLFPLNLKVEPTDLSSAIKAVKEDLRKIPHKGIGYGVLAYITSLSPVVPERYPTLCFNYMGQWDNTLTHDKLFSFSQESPGNNVSEQNKKTYLIEINTEIIGKKLLVHWNYSTSHYYSNTIENLSAYFMKRLRQLIHHCSHTTTFGYTQSDFKLVKLTEKILENKINIISKVGN